MFITYLQIMDNTKWIKWAENVGLNIIKSVEVNIGDNHTTIQHIGNENTIQHDYYKNKCVNVEIRNYKHEKEMKELIEKYSQKSHKNKV